MDNAEIVKRLKALPRWDVPPDMEPPCQDSDGGWISAADLDALIAEIEGACPECGGEGLTNVSTEISPDGLAICPTCKGTGRKP